MVQSAKQNARTAAHLAQLEAEIRDAVANGVSLRELQELVSTIVSEDPTTDLITLAQASSDYGVSYSTLLGWVHRGLLKKVDRQTFPAPGGGKVLVNRPDVITLIDSPPKSGRPKKRQ